MSGITIKLAFSSLYYFSSELTRLRRLETLKFKSYTPTQLSLVIKIKNQLTWLDCSGYLVISLYKVYRA
jgi:hypothetical protein